MKFNPNPDDFRDSYGNPLRGGYYALEKDVTNLVNVNPRPSRITGAWGVHLLGNLSEAKGYSPKETSELTPVHVGNPLTTGTYLLDSNGMRASSDSGLLVKAFDFLFKTRQKA